jgi:hypothetical protein
MLLQLIIIINNILTPHYYNKITIFASQNTNTKYGQSESICGDVYI